MDINKLKEMEKTEAMSAMPFEEIPDSFEGTLLSEEIRQDAHGVNCLFWSIGIKGASQVITQKFTPTQIRRIRQFAEINRIEDTTDLIGKTMGFKKVTGNRNEKPRWYPAAIL